MSSFILSALFLLAALSVLAAGFLEPLSCDVAELGGFGVATTGGFLVSCLAGAVSLSDDRVRSSLTVRVAEVSAD